MGPEILSTARPTKLRLAGFLATALGGLLLGLGAVAAWGKIGPTDTRGVDIPEGKAALVVAALVLLSIPAIRIAGGRGARQVIAWMVVVGSLLAGALAVWALADATMRIGGVAIDREAHRIALETGLPEADLRRQLERLTDVRIEPGVWLTVAGAVLGALGGALSIAWANHGKAPAEETPGVVPESGSEA